MRLAILFLGVLLAAAAAFESRQREPNQTPARPNDVRAGAKLFRQHCAQCHGRSAQGIGRAPSLHSEKVRNAPTGYLLSILTNGILRRGMPSWSHLPEAQRRQIIAYLKQLQ